MSSIFEDTRRIETIYWGDGGELKVGGTSDVTKIEAYREYGEMSHVPWFKVWRGDVLWQRINAKTVSGVVYFDEEQADEPE